MQYRNFGNTDLVVSETGFGAWAIGGGAMIGSTAIGWGDVDDTESKKAIHRALDLGINFFDTADIYGLGHSEEILGSVLRDKKEIIIATKAGNVSKNNQFTVEYSKVHILKSCEASLRRLKRNEIDYYQLHSARLEHLQKGECVEAMVQLKKQGKIRYWGLSLNSYDPLPEAEYMLQNNLGSGFQLVLNLLNQRALPALKLSAEKGLGIIARMALQFGLLTGKFDHGFSFSRNDHRKNRITPELVSVSNKALKPVWDLCEKYGMNKTQLALSYVLSYPQVSTVITGIRTAAHAEANTSGFKKLDEDDMKRIEQAGISGFIPVMEMIQSLG
ncbi:MAG: aldo/keto reductase [Chitinophagales bacterium]|nr:aldo/keto reductase [Chitinophagales bacterium]